MLWYVLIEVILGCDSPGQEKIVRTIPVRLKAFPFFPFLWVLFLAAAAESAPGVPSYEKGNGLFDQKCAPCHTIGGGNKIGPDLKGVTERRKRDWLLRWIENPEQVIASGDEIAREMVKDYAIRMPSVGLSKEEIMDLLSYLESFQATVPSSAALELRKERLGEVSFSSSTYLQFFEDARGNRYGPLNERIDVEVLDRKKKWSFHSSGLAQYDLRTLSDKKREMDELTYAFFTYAPFLDLGPVFKVGRYYLFDGVAAEHIDGIQSSWAITPATVFSLFAGRPVETEFDGKHGDYVYGCRVSQKIEKKAEVGVSFLKEDNDGGRYREELGLDVWLLPVRPVELQGHSYWNNITSGWMEHSYTLRIPLQKFLISGLFGQSDYRNAFFARTMTAFSPDLLGKDEGLTKAGAALEYRLGKSITASINYTGYAYRQAGDARYYGMAVTSGMRGLSAGLSMHRMDGETERLRYLELRAYAKKGFGKMTLILDVMDVRYNLPINSLRDAYSISGTAIYRINNALSAGADIAYRKNPDFTNQTMALFKLIYNFRKDL